MKETMEGDVACYMDDAIQSATSDERVYHEGLVGPAMLSLRSSGHCSRVLILGGGEGATAREVLRSSTVTEVRMIDWDRDVLQLFQTQYPQWAKGAWSDPRLQVECDDVFSVLSSASRATMYDLVVIDLFDWENTTESIHAWRMLLTHLTRWLAPTGSLVCYMGLHSAEMTELLHVQLPWLAELYPRHTFTPYSVHVPSFEGSAVFLLVEENLKDSDR